MELYFDDVESSQLEHATKIAENSFKISSEKIEKPKLIYKSTI